jgi:peroxiredoxin
MPRLALVSLGLLLVSPGCKSMQNSVPGWDDPVGPQEIDVAGPPESDAAEGEDEPTALADAADAKAAAEDEGGDDGAGDSSAAAPGDDPPADPAPNKADPTPNKADAKAPPAELALPKAKYTKVDKSCGKDPGVGQKLKSFSLATSDGKTVTQSTYRGRVLVVNFWGTWCKPCLKELPEFDQLFRRYRKHGLAMLAIATDEDAEPVNEFKKKRKLAAKLAIGGEDYAGKYASPQFPFTFIVDTSGTIKASYRGYKPGCMGKLEADIREQLQIRAEQRTGG